MSCHAHFRAAQVRLQGDYKIFTRQGQQGRLVDNFFCPECGSTVCWVAQLRPDHYGIALGAFTDPAFPAPTLSIWEDFKYPWITLPAGVEHHARARPQGDPPPLRWAH
jgi:hypothetical protein